MPIWYWYPELGNDKGGEGMAKNKNNQLKNNKNAQPNDQEFAGENGLEKVVRQAQKKPK